MAGKQYFTEIAKVLARMEQTQLAPIEQAGELCAECIAQEGIVHLFGSGHSVLPVMDIFPRYGSFVGFHPLLDPRLMWFNVIGPGGAPELLWIERQEGYVNVMADDRGLREGDVMVIYSHGGLNAAPVDMALMARKRGLSVVAITSMDNHAESRPTHSSGKHLADVADIVIDNCVPPQDSLVTIDGWEYPVAAGSTVAVVAVSMALLAETAAQLAQRGISRPTFVSPNVGDVSPGHNQDVFAAYGREVENRGNVCVGQ
jgi:uncharacterized phosphosugar-binding protein